MDDTKAGKCKTMLSPTIPGRSRTRREAALKVRLWPNRAIEDVNVPDRKVFIPPDEYFKPLHNHETRSWYPEAAEQLQYFLILSSSRNF